MAATQAQRAALYNDLAEAMNPEAADTLMDQLPPTGWDQMATKDDLANTEQRMQAGFAETNAAMQAGFAELRALIATESAERAKGFADAAKERAEIIKSQAELIRAQARQLYLIVAAIAVGTVSVWVAVLTSVIVS